jgi:hypothetical protein
MQLIVPRTILLRRACGLCAHDLFPLPTCIKTTGVDGATPGMTDHKRKMFGLPRIPVAVTVFQELQRGLIDPRSRARISNADSWRA